MNTLMLQIARSCWLAVALALSGCSRAQPIPTNPPAPTALSLDDWKKLPIPEKYDEASFERLRMGNPQLKSDRAWKAYMSKEIMPERKRDIPRASPSP